MAATESARAASRQRNDGDGEPLLLAQDSAKPSFDALYAKAPIGIALLAADGGILHCNAVFQKIIGYTAAELALMTEQALRAPESAPADGLVAAGFAAYGDLAPCEREYIARGGIKVPVRVSGVALEDVAGAGRCWWFVEDITARRQMMDALKQSESEARMLEAAASHTGSMVVIADAAGRIEWVNESFQRLTGFTRGEVVGRTPGSFLQGPDTDPHTVAAMRAALAAGHAFSVEVINYTRARQPYWVAIECAPVFDHLGRLERFVAIERDITAQKEAAQALRASQERYRRAIEGASDIVFERDLATERFFLSERICEVLAIAPAAIPQSSAEVYALIHPEDRAAHRSHVEAMLNARETITWESRFRRGDGGFRWLRVRGRCVHDAAGRPILTAGTFSDVHDAHLAAAALRELQERFARALDGASDVIWERDLKSGRFYVAERIREILCHDKAQSPVALEEVFNQVHPDDLDAQRRNVAALIAGTETMTWETRFRTGDGGYRWLRVRGKTIRDAAGAPVLTSGTVSDVHDARLASEELRSMQVRYARALEGASDGIWERAAGSDVLQCSDRVAEILGYAPGALPNSRFALHELTHPDDRETAGRAMVAMFRGKQSVTWEARMRGADGEYRWVRGRGRAVHDVQGQAILSAGTVTDIQETKLAEAAMQALQARYQRALDGSNDGIWERDIATDMFYFSSRFDEILGYASGGVPRQREQWLTLVHPDDLAGHLGGASGMLQVDTATQWETRFRTIDGEYRWLRFRGIASRDATGKVIATSGTASDIHAAKLAEAELRRHRDNLAQLVEARTAGLEQASREAQAQRQKAEQAREAAERSRQAAVAASLAKSEFLANMSHELRTPMHGIISFANFGVEKFERVEPAKLLHYFRNIQKSGSRLLLLLNDLLDLSKLEAGKMVMQRQRTDLGRLIDEAMAEFEALARSRGIELRAGLLAQTSLCIDATRMLQVLRNLLSNALKFTPAGGRVEVTCRLLPAPDGDAPGSFLELCVRDDGIGIPEDELEAVFDKFVQSSTTNTGAGGTGLGLAISREIVAAHGGSIRARNNLPPARGASFLVCLPLEAAEAVPAPALTEAF